MQLAERIVKIFLACKGECTGLRALETVQIPLNEHTIYFGERKSQ
jgi:hypothetical protein